MREVVYKDEKSIEARPQPKFVGDDDFIGYVHTFYQEVMRKAQSIEDENQKEYYRGMLYALKSVSKVYDNLLLGEFI